MKNINQQSSFKKTKKVAVFSFSLLVVALSFGLFAPVIRTNAAEQQLQVSANISTVLSMSLDNDSVFFNITPTLSGVFASKAVMATVDTNSDGGYELYFSSVDNNTAMTSATTSETITSDFNSTVTSSTMANNKWGYSLDNTNFSKIPTLTNQTKIKAVAHAPAINEKKITVNFATKVDDTISTGIYSKKVVFTAVAIQAPEPGEMQDFTCSTLANTGSEVRLTDTRDGNVYLVKKLADGKCWMTNDLRLGSATETITLTTDDSDVASDFELPIAEESLTSSSFTQYSFKEVYMNNDVNKIYYNWFTATAGEGTKSKTSGETSHSICPKGWRLPTGGSSGEYNTLYSYYNSGDLLRGEPGFTRPGLPANGAMDGQGYFGGWWSSTPYPSNNTHAYTAYMNGNLIYFEGSATDKAYGRMVRCVARN